MPIREDLARIVHESTRMGGVFVVGPVEAVAASDGLGRWA